MVGDCVATAANQNDGVKKSSVRPVRSPSRRLARSRGFTLIEVMVALIVLVLGVLGAAAMTLNALRDSKQSSLRSQAVAAAYELGDLIRMNPTETAVFLAPPPGGPVSTCYTSGCTVTELSTNDYYEWHAKTTSTAVGLPNLVVKVCRNAAFPTDMTTCDDLPTSPITIRMRWDVKLNDGTFVAASSSGPTFWLAVQQPTLTP